MDFLVVFEEWKWKIHTKYTETHTWIYEQIFILEKRGQKQNEKEV